MDGEAFDCRSEPVASGGRDAAWSVDDVVRSKPYRSTPVFDETDLPQALRRAHSTKAGVWGVIVVLDGRLRYFLEDGSSQLLRPGRPGLIRPEEPHRVEPVGSVSMRVDFFDHEPRGIHPWTC